VDTLGEVYVDPAVLTKTVSVVAGWSGVDVLLVSFPMLLGARLGSSSERWHRRSGQGSRQRANIIHTGFGGHILFPLRVPTYWTFTQAARAVNHLVRYHEKRNTC
jgi:hypothetical protein